MNEEDLPFVIEIENICYPNPWKLSSFKGEIDNRPISNPYVIIYRPLEKIIGYIIYWHIRDEVQISNIAISPDFRQLGVGEGVFRKVLQEHFRRAAKKLLVKLCQLTADDHGDIAENLVKLLQNLDDAVR